MFKKYKKYGKLSDRDLGMLTIGLAIGVLAMLLVTVWILGYVFSLVLSRL
ncbi:MAG: hypothetical protein V1765_00595 [bacterium]